MNYLQIKYIFIFLLNLVSLLSKGQKLKPLNEIRLGKGTNNNLILHQDLSISINPDSTWIYHIIEFKKNDNIVFVDSVDLAPDGFNFRLLKLNNKDDLILIVEAVYEYVSYYPVYILQQSKMKKIGNLNIRLDCKNCDALNYPLNDIVVKGNKNIIEFTFKEDLVHYEKPDYPKMKKNEVRFIYEIDNKIFKIENNTSTNKF
jgi:hypothetical protein